jgi:hypothetical protein
LQRLDFHPRRAEVPHLADAVVGPFVSLSCTKLAAQIEF